MFDYYSKRERAIRGALKTIARQRVALILPGNVLVLERSPPPTESFDEAVQTCLIRGWAEVLYEEMPSRQFEFQGKAPVYSETSTRPHYKLTEGGWNAIRGTHSLVIVAIVLSALSLAAGAASTWLAWEQLTNAETTKPATCGPIK